MLYCFLDVPLQSYSIEELFLAAAFKFKVELGSTGEAEIQVSLVDQIVKVKCGDDVRFYTYEELGF